MTKLKMILNLIDAILPEANMTTGVRPLTIGVKFWYRDINVQVTMTEMLKAFHLEMDNSKETTIADISKISSKVYTSKAFSAGDTRTWEIGPDQDDSIGLVYEQVAKIEDYDMEMGRIDVARDCVIEFINSANINTNKPQARLFKEYYKDELNRVACQLRSDIKNRHDIAMGELETISKWY